MIITLYVNAPGPSVAGRLASMHLEGLSLSRLWNARNAAADDTIATPSAPWRPSVIGRRHDHFHSVVQGYGEPANTIRPSSGVLKTCKSIWNKEQWIRQLSSAFFLFCHNELTSNSCLGLPTTLKRRRHRVISVFLAQPTTTSSETSKWSRNSTTVVRSVSASFPFVVSDSITVWSKISKACAKKTRFLYDEAKATASLT